MEKKLSSWKFGEVYNQNGSIILGIDIIKNNEKKAIYRHQQNGIFYVMVDDLKELGATSSGDYVTYKLQIYYKDNALKDYTGKINYSTGTLIDGKRWIRVPRDISLYWGEDISKIVITMTGSYGSYLTKSKKRRSMINYSLMNYLCRENVKNNYTPFASGSGNIVNYMEAIEF